MSDTQSKGCEHCIHFHIKRRDEATGVFNGTCWRFPTPISKDDPNYGCGEFRPRPVETDTEQIMEGTGHGQSIERVTEDAEH